MSNNLRETISRKTSFDAGDYFETEQQVRDYFTPESQREMWGDDAVTDEALLTEWADAVIENRWNMRDRVVTERLEKLFDEHIQLYGDAIENQYLCSTEVLLGVAPDEVTTADHELFSTALKHADIDDNYQISMEQYANGKWHVVIKQLYDADGNALD